MREGYTQYYGLQREASIYIPSGIEGRLIVEREVDSDLLGPSIPEFWRSMAASAIKHTAEVSEVMNNRELCPRLNQLKDQDYFLRTGSL